jgi:hypothetical protein
MSDVQPICPWFRVEISPADTITSLGEGKQYPDNPTVILWFNNK